jgi:hypothetical protein
MLRAAGTLDAAQTSQSVARGARAATRQRWSRAPESPGSSRRVGADVNRRHYRPAELAHARRLRARRRPARMGPVSGSEHRVRQALGWLVWQHTTPVWLRRASLSIPPSLPPSLSPLSLFFSLYILLSLTPFLPPSLFLPPPASPSFARSLSLSPSPSRAPPALEAASEFKRPGGRRSRT